MWPNLATNDVAVSHDQRCGRISRPTMWPNLTTNYVAV
ncbi:hypothetical protein COLO4_37960 [Corchorus olitorius]|uniref:Uncharacterized protein n=1 Tax=Corchorus olitorius TaxID=93759 RepID=A0A1R3FXT5_9ROSI|nr:hypothetical protein COLO4_37960 [Corchorus olitorius]